MNAIENLIEFLNRKGFEVNSKNSSESSNTFDIYSNINNINKLLNRQKLFNAIMHELNTICKIINSNKDDDTYIKSELNKYFLIHREKIINNLASFDEHHPLFGYKPFADFLMLYYIEEEDYEKCTLIKKNSSYYESYIS